MLGVRPLRSRRDYSVAATRRRSTPRPTSPASRDGILSRSCSTTGRRAGSLPTCSHAAGLPAGFGESGCLRVQALTCQTRRSRRGVSWATPPTRRMTPRAFPQVNLSFPVFTGWRWPRRHVPCAGPNAATRRTEGLEGIKPCGHQARCPHTTGRTCSGRAGSPDFRRLGLTPGQGALSARCRARAGARRSATDRRKGARRKAAQTRRRPGGDPKGRNWLPMAATTRARLLALGALPLQHEPGRRLLLSPTVLIVLGGVLPIIWAVLLAFQRVRLINIRRAGCIGNLQLDNFEVLTSPGFWTRCGRRWSPIGATSARSRRLVAALRCAAVPRPGSDPAAMLLRTSRRWSRRPSSCTVALTRSSHRQRMGTNSSL